MKSASAIKNGSSHGPTNSLANIARPTPKQSGPFSDRQPRFGGVAVFASAYAIPMTKSHHCGWHSEIIFLQRHLGHGWSSNDLDELLRSSVHGWRSIGSWSCVGHGWLSVGHPC